LSAIHFQRSQIRQVSCYTLFKGFQPPWPPSCCLNLTTAFVGSMSEHLGALTMLSVHPASPNLLTKQGPLMDHPFNTRASIKHTGFLTDSEFETKMTALRHQFFESFLYPIKLFHRSIAILRETSTGTSYQAVRLVFRRYSQLTRSICTSESLLASIYVSIDFTMVNNSSLLFGSLTIDLCSHPSCTQSRAAASARGLWWAPLRRPFAFTSSFFKFLGFIHPQLLPMIKTP